MLYRTLLCMCRHRRHCGAVVSRGWVKASVLCFCVMVPFQYLSCSSLHRLADLPLDCFPSKGFQVVIHRLSRILLTCPVQFHFRLLTCSITSMTCIFSLTQMFDCSAPAWIFNIHLSIFVYASANFCFANNCVLNYLYWL